VGCAILIAKLNLSSYKQNTYTSSFMAEAQAFDKALDLLLESKFITGTR